MQIDPKLKVELVLAAVELMGRAGRHGTVRVQGMSMQPTLQPGQLLAVEFTPPRPRRGDMLVFRQGETLLVHRLLGPARPLDGRPRLRTRGDGVITLDPPVDLDRVVARVVAFGTGEQWRSTRRRAARFYARCVAWHDFFWAAMGVLSLRAERSLGMLNIDLALRPTVHAIDRRLLHWVHRALFERMHARVPKPEYQPPASTRAQSPPGEDRR